MANVYQGYLLVMSFDDDDDKPAPAPKEKEDDGLSSKNMNTMIMLVALAAGFFLFKDEIMGLFSGGLPGLGTSTPTTETEAPAETPAAETEGGEKAGAGGGGGKHGKRGGRRGRRGKRGGRGGRKAMRDKMKAEMTKSNYTFANVNYW